MDFGALGENFPIFAIAIGLILLQIILRLRRKPEKTQRALVQNLLAEIKLNMAVAEVFNSQQKPKKFLLTTWQMNKTKIGFLDQPLQSALTDTFMIAEDFNHQLAAAKKHKSAGYLPNLDKGKLNKLHGIGKDGLEEWLLKHVGQKEPPPKYPNLMDSIFGQ